MNIIIFQSLTYCMEMVLLFIFFKFQFKKKKKFCFCNNKPRWMLFLNTIKNSIREKVQIDGSISFESTIWKLMNFRMFFSQITIKKRTTNFLDFSLSLSQNSCHSCTNSNEHTRFNY